MNTIEGDFALLNVGEVVKFMPKAAGVFSKLKIDFCCGGNIKFVEACEKKGLDPDEIWEQINDAKLKGSGAVELDFDSFEVDFLADYIYNVHHKYLYEKLPEINEMVAKVYHKHNEKYAHLKELHELYTELEADLVGHLPKEEQVLFPYAKTLLWNRSANTTPSRPFFDTITNPLSVMNAEHDRVGEIIHRLRVITNDYTPPDDACNSHLVMLDMLKELDANLIQHIHLENNILFPKIVGLEQFIFSEN